MAAGGSSSLAAAGPRAGRAQARRGVAPVLLGGARRGGRLRWACCWLGALIWWGGKGRPRPAADLAADCPSWASIANLRSRATKHLSARADADVLGACQQKPTASECGGMRASKQPKSDQRPGSQSATGQLQCNGASCAEPGAEGE